MHKIYNSNIGTLLIAASDEGITELRIGKSISEVSDGFVDVYGRAEMFNDWADDIVRFINGEHTNPERVNYIPLVMKGSEFELKVWNALRAIPEGETRTYSDIAAAIGAEKSTRAVGTACGKNKIAVLVPCHRVVPKSGGVGQYRWGSDIKQMLLGA